ncbi:MAG: nucleoside deaminase [Bacteroidales bacterium]|nr:nucleoside deaminase [Bacteroidales bacterium]
MSYPLFSDEYFMNEALKEAQKALSMNEVPVGAVIVADNTIIARAHNSTETLIDVTAHAEVIAITSASNHLGAKYLTQAALYVTLEPCVMCAGACNWAQLARIVYGAPDPKAGYSRIIQDILHPKTKVTAGVLKTESEKMLKAFFREKR